MVYKIIGLKEINNVRPYINDGEPRPCKHSEVGDATHMAIEGIDVTGSPVIITIPKDAEGKYLLVDAI